MWNGGCVADNNAGTIVVCDAGPLIHLDEMDCIDLLRLFANVLIPETVWIEVQRHRPAVLRRRRVRLHRIEVIPDPQPRLVNLITSLALDPGEEAALRLMQSFPDAM